MKKRAMFTHAELQASIDRQTSEVGECLEWHGYRYNGSPQIWCGDRYRQLRRVVYEMGSGKKITGDRHPKMTCCNDHCVRYEHIALKTTREVALIAAKQGKFGTASRAAAISAGIRAKGKTKLNPTLAAEIRASDEPGHVLGKQYGVNPSFINRIRKGQVWRESARGTSVFNL